MSHLVTYDFYGLYSSVLNAEHVRFTDTSNNLKINGIKCAKGNRMSSSQREEETFLLHVV